MPSVCPRTGLADYSFPSQYVEIVEHFLDNRGTTAQTSHQQGLGSPERLYEAGVITGEQLKALFEVCAQHADANKPLSAQLLEQFPVTAHGLLGIVVMTSPTLEYALEAALKFYRW